MRSSLSRAGLAADAAASCTRVRAGRIALREPETACGRAALLGFVSPVSFQLRRQGWENCGEMAGRAYGKTVWSWPSLLRSSSCGGGSRVNRRGAGDFRGVREARTNSAPGRARHKPSDHRAGKAVCWASPVCCCAVLPACAFRAADRGCRPAPGLPCALLAREGERRSKARANSAARARSHVCKLRCGVGTAMAPVLRNASWKQA
ncbi:hypothetical protein ABIA43_001009 [Bradyrhizobium sp. USDA 328]